jgi:hypothetical protein
MLQVRSKDSVESGDLRWYSPNRDIANIIPPVLKRVFTRCGPDVLSDYEQMTLAELGISNEDLGEAASSMARLITVLRKGTVDPQAALEVLGILEIDEDNDGDECGRKYKLRESAVEAMQKGDLKLDPIDPFMGLTNQEWCMYSGAVPSNVYLFIGMIFFQEMMQQFMNSYRETVTQGEADPNESNLDDLRRVLVSPKPKPNWYRRLISYLYWRNHAYRR